MSVTLLVVASVLHRPPQARRRVGRVAAVTGLSRAALPRSRRGDHRGDGPGVLGRAGRPRPPDRSQVAGRQAADERDDHVAAALQMRGRVGPSHCGRVARGRRCSHPLLRTHLGVLAGDDSAEPGADVMAGVRDVIDDHPDRPVVSLPGQRPSQPVVVVDGAREFRRRSRAAMAAA